MHDIEAPRPQTKRSHRSSRNPKDSSHGDDYSDRRKSTKRSHHRSKKSTKTKKSILDLKGEKRELEAFVSRRSRDQPVSLFNLSEDQYFDSFDTDETSFDSVMPRRKYSKQEIKEQTKDLDEAFLTYDYAEKAARKIQLAFRDRQQAMLDAEKSDASTTESESNNFTEAIIQKDDADDPSQINPAQLGTLLFLMGGFLFTWIPKLLACCRRILGGGDDTGAVETVANATMQPGGGGAAGPTPTGGEAGVAGGGAQAGAQGAMAAQAASSAASGAASGVASGAAAGAAASSAAAAATAGATAAAAAGATQVATVAAVSTVAAAAAATTAAVVNNSTPEPILSICGIANPDIRSGRMVMFFEGLPRQFDDRESGLVENLVMQSYNELTLGTNVAVTGCLDPLSREMQSIKIVNQTLSLGTGDLDPNNLEVFFEAQVSCDRCSDTSPLFSEEQEEAPSGNINGNSTTNASGDNTTTDFGTVPNATTEGVVLSDDEQSRQLLLSIDFRSQKFFQKLIQLVIFETEELTDEGELPEGFVQISKALVMVTTDEKEEETLVTEIKYKRQASTVNDGGSGGGSGGGSSGGGSGGGGSSDGSAGGSAGAGSGSGSGSSGGGSSGGSNGSGGGGNSGSGGESGGESGGNGGNVMAAFEFIFVDESGEVQKETVEITEEGAVVPTTAFPTFQPSLTPTRAPSVVPTPSPTFQPSHGPTDSPSSVPTNVFSGQPTQLPSVKPSEVPSLSPSESPSDVPSAEPSEAPSEVPSVVPSEAPSQIPSVVPSDAPSSSPSMTPSEVPSFVPSEAPSFVPSLVPSEFPSDAPSASPSGNPSANPSPSPSAVPSPNPSSSPTAMYVGCYADQDPSRPAPDNGPRNFSYAHPVVISDVNTCRSICRGQNKVYAGLQVGAECWCDDTHFVYGGASNCNEFFCGGLECGGAWALAVYLSGYS